MQQLFKLVMNNLDTGERFKDWHFGIDTLQDKLIELGTRLEFTGYSWRVQVQSYKRRSWETVGTLSIIARYSHTPPTPGFSV